MIKLVVKFITDYLINNNPPKAHAFVKIELNSAMLATPADIIAMIRAFTDSLKADNSSLDKLYNTSGLSANHLINIIKQIIRNMTHINHSLSSQWCTLLATGMLPEIHAFLTLYLINIKNTVTLLDDFTNTRPDLTNMMDLYTPISAKNKILVSLYRRIEEMLNIPLDDSLFPT